MQFSKTFPPIAIVIFIVSLAACNDKAGQDTTGITSTRDTSTRNAPIGDENTGYQAAKEGDTVWVLVNHVKADKRQQFEHFVHEVFWDSSSKLSDEQQRVFRKTRILHPTRQEKDGTYSYLFIMDPYIPGEDYSIEKILYNIYGSPKAVEYIKMLEETQKGEQTAYFLVQSRH